jgi:hypothetical protein
MKKIRDITIYKAIKCFVVGVFDGVLTDFPMFVFLV